MSLSIGSNIIPKYIDECALYLQKPPGSVCMSDGMVREVGRTIGAAGKPPEILSVAKQKTGCTTERCVLQKLAPVLGESRVKAEINTYLKLTGPTDTQLLSNVNIDRTLQQWALKFSDFFPYNFNMINYATHSYRDGYIYNTPDTLATIHFIDLYTGEYDGRKYRCAACVINSDTYQGPGKHWMALFADARDDERWTVEFFNSSGNAPAPEWVSWMERTKLEMEMISERFRKYVDVDVVRVSSIRQQKSRTECGVYSLFYIWSRLNGVPYEYFRENRISDELMFEFRQHLFASDAPWNVEVGENIKKFDWDKFQSMVRIQWE